jgi:hypothetical protein
MSTRTLVNDPIGTLIFLGTRHCDSEGNEIDYSHFKEDILRIIEKPGLMIEVFENPIKFYYFGSINWDHTVLIGVHRLHGFWKVNELIDNPSGRVVLKLLKRGGIFLL